mgnify:CR=1 FL=1
MSRPAVEIRNLVKEYVDARTKQRVRAVDDVTFDIRRGGQGPRPVRLTTAASTWH